MLNACSTTFDFDVYQPRNPKASAYYRCVEDHFELLKTGWLPARGAYKSLQSLRLAYERHGVFSGYCGKAIWPHNEDGLENLARGTCPPEEDHPSVFFSRAHDIYCG